MRRSTRTSSLARWFKINGFGEISPGWRGYERRLSRFERLMKLIRRQQPLNMTIVTRLLRLQRHVADHRSGI